MALVPWTYNNPRINRKSMPNQQFSFQGWTVEILQDTEIEVDVTKNTGLKLWDGAYLLARYLENKTDFPQGFWTGKNCLELGAGCGLVGMVAWLQNANVILTDLKETLIHTQKCLDHNMARFNEKRGDAGGSRIRTESLLWGSEDCQKFTEPFDVILGSDIIYHPAAVKDLIKTLDTLSGESTTILISYKRRGLGEEVFFEMLKNYSLFATDVPKDRHPPDFQGTEYKLIKIQKRV